VGKPEGKRPLGRFRCRWKNNIKMDLQEVAWGYGLDYSGSGQEKLAGSYIRGNETSGSIKYGEFLD
jgi:hypothetical protein